LSFFYSKTASSLPKTEVLHEHIVFQKDLPASQKNEILHEKMTKYVPKRPTSPAKTEVLHEKKSIFLLKKTTQPRKKLKFCMKKCPKNDQKMDPKNHPTPQKTRSFA